MRHFISLDQFSEEEILDLLLAAREFEEKEAKITKQLFVGNLFFEPSTRTKMSFEIALKKLGLEVLNFSAEHSSVEKGESLYDTVKTFEALGAHALILRHEDNYWYESLKNSLSIPLINAGAGTKEHPSQSLLDLYTIHKQFNTLENITITIIGDIKHSRVAQSNTKILDRLGAEVLLCAAEPFIDEDLPYSYISIDQAVEISDVVMLLRPQTERHRQREVFDNYLTNYGLTKDRERKMKENAIILHPAPIHRGVEIDSSLVESRRSRIFEQMRNGVFIRMAIVTKILKEWGILHETDIKKHPTLRTTG